ncbi:hypothetical protein, conserved [Eimeria brunetti]|uniref:Uncharacterized protein n=1 Tax=Eimeria brunetti TaxID=51314 RepID=U6LVC4_9EIME|nr:hypothetical protein, conserved [Eimeria brunetti]
MPVNFHRRQSPKRLPVDAHLPPPLASERYASEDDKKTSPLLKQNENPEDTFNSLLPSEGLQGNCRGSKAVDSAGDSPLATTACRSTTDLQAKAEMDGVAQPVIDKGISCSATASIDPLLASALLQHLSHMQHGKDPEVLSRLLASVSAATANYGQQQRVKILSERKTAARLQGSHFDPAAGNPAASRHLACVESLELVADTEDKLAATPWATALTEAPSDCFAPAARPASLSATEAAVRGRRGFPMGTHELRESWAEFASAAVDAAHAFSPGWGKYKRTCFSGQIADASCGQDRTHREAASLDANAGSCRMKSRVILSDQDTIRRLKEQGLHRALQFVTLPWSTFVSQFRKSIDLDTGQTSLGSSSGRPAKGGKRKGFVPAGAEVARIITRREPFQLVSLFLRHSSPTVGVEATASAMTDDPGKTPFPSLTGIALLQQQELQLPSRQKFPFGIAFSDTSQGLLIDTGPLLPPVVPKDAPSSLKNQIKRQHDKKMNYAAQAQALLQRHQQRRQNTPTPIVGPFDESTTATAATKTANSTAVQSRELASTSAHPSAFHSFSMISTRDSSQPPAAVTSSRARKEEQHRSRLLHATSDALSAAANMRVLTLRIARPFVVQLPLLCAQSAFVTTRALAAAKDLGACCAAAAAALQTLGLRLDEPFNYAHPPRRRIPRPPTPDLVLVREEVLISLEMAFRSPRFLALWQQASADVKLLEHTPSQGRAEDNSHRYLSHLLPQAAYLYSVVFQALMNDVHREPTHSAPITAWQQQQQSALQFCNILANAIATVGHAAIPYTLVSFTYMLNACRCLAAGAISARSVSEQQQLKQSLIMLLRRTEKSIMLKVEQALWANDANTEVHSSRDIRLSLIALARSHQSAGGSASPATTAAAATDEESVHSVVYALANKAHLTRNTVHRWVTEAAAAEELRLQRSRPR